jgi:hypothetical protein
MYGRAIPQIDANGKGIHVLWFGPTRWGYSPFGWVIERRLYSGPRVEPVCNSLNSNDLLLLERARERRLVFGVLTLEDGFWAKPLKPDSKLFGTPPEPAQVFRVRFDQPHDGVDLTLTGKSSFAYALRGGKVVATSGPLSGPTMKHNFREIDIDSVVAHVLDPRGLTVCVIPDEPEQSGWKLVGRRQLPLMELDSSLTDTDKEVQEALNRLLPAESLVYEEVRDLLARLRPVVAKSGPPPPSFWTLLLREPEEEEVMEVGGLDPLRALVSHPSWRRALGFGLFDNDSALVPGQKYQYRITGNFPLADRTDELYGFATVPTGTALPAVFHLGDLELRLSRPARVELAWDPSGGTPAAGRRGLRLQPSSGSPWLLSGLGDSSLVLDFPRPVRVVDLELEEGHNLKWRAGSMGLGPAESGTVAPGPRPRLTFSAPREQVRLEGKGLLFSIRVPADPAFPPDKPVSLSMVLPPVEYKDTARPAPPIFVAAGSLQKTPPATPPDGSPPPREALGLEVAWRPALLGGLDVFPPGSDVAPPVEATLFEVEHREEKESGDPLSDWTPILPPPEENWITGDRDQTAHENRPFPGADLLELFPEEGKETPGDKLDLRWRDVFDFPEGLPEGADLHRKPPGPGGFHRYRIRAVDTVGRASLGWSESNAVRLEKRVPPPEPVGPNPDADADPLPSPRGVQARVLVPGAPDLTPAEVTLLGTSKNVLVLRWGWHEQQREQDPYVTEFRVYARHGDPDSVTGRITQVTNVGQGQYDVRLEMDRAVTAGAATGLYVQAPGAFRVDSHGEGTVFTARLSTRLVMPGGAFPAPALGSVRLPVRLAASQTRPSTWDERVQVVPLTSATTYEVVLRDRLNLSDVHPRDTVWLGVSAADDQSYVADLLPGGGRPGNESPIVPVRCDGRYAALPQLPEAPPPLGSVPRVRTPEPRGREVGFDLDLTGFVPGNPFAPGSRVRPERVSAGAVFRALRVDSASRILARVPEPPRPGEVEVQMGQELAPADQNAIRSALTAFDLDRLADRYLLYLASRHPYRDRLFEAATPDTVAFGPFRQELPGAGERYVYRLRRGDAGSRLSRGAQVAALVVRVPSPVPGAPPQRVPAGAGDLPGELRFRVPGDSVLTHAVVFETPPPPARGPVRGAELLRAPDAIDPARLRLRTAEGALLTPRVVDLAGPEVTVEADGSRTVTVTAEAGETVVVWAVTVTGDGIPSLLAGPWSVTSPVTVNP